MRDVGESVVILYKIVKTFMNLKFCLMHINSFFLRSVFTTLIIHMMEIAVTIKNLIYTESKYQVTFYIGLKFNKNQANRVN